MTAFLHLPPTVQKDIWSHLLRDGDDSEAVAFAFVKHALRDGDHLFEFVCWYAVPRDGFQIRSGYHIELTDEARATVIKRAHDLDACVVEFHSHLGPWPAAFSASDRIGLAEFVPHVRWRLRGRPYVAVVVTKSDFDGLAWITESDKAERLGGIVVGNDVLSPTRLSSLEEDDDRSL